MRTRWISIALLSALSATIHAQQTDNHLLRAVPPPRSTDSGQAGKVTIDGKLGDWDLSGQIEVFANLRTRNTYSTKVAAMYDKANLYLAVTWRDPTPMHNMVDARHDQGSGWRSDCLQLRVRTDMTMHLDCWYSTAAKRAVVSCAYGRYGNKSDREHSNNFYAGKRIDLLAKGAQEAFRMGADGKSYTQEIALPWKLITGQAAIHGPTGKPYKEPKGYAAGDTFRMGMEFLWGGPDGNTWPIHRYADLLAEGHTSREFFWTAERAWGPVKLAPKGNLDLPKPDYGPTDAYLQKTEGPVALKYSMPFDGFATLVIEDEKGHRVRNLVGMAPRSKGEQTDYWDGTDDEGKLVPVGAYRWRGLVHQGIDATYEASYGTPGVPPWDNAQNTGAWMSDHQPPCAVAAGENMMVLAAGGSEAGWAMIGVDLKGRKRWGQRKFQGIVHVAADDKYVYTGIAGGHHGQVPSVGRAHLKTGKYAPFDTEKGSQLIVPVLEEGEQGRVAGIAAGRTQLAVTISGLDVLRLYDRNSMKRVSQLPLPAPAGLTFDTSGNILAVSGKAIVKVAGGKATKLIEANLDEPADVAVDPEGRVLVSDRAAHQIKVFDRAGRFLRSIGLDGGRPKPGKWTPDGMRRPTGLDVDPQGRVWVAERDLYPKRVSVWSVDGKLLQDFIGPTTYGGMAGFADGRDKTRLFGSGCEWKIDYGTGKATVVSNCLTEVAEAGDILRKDGREYFMGKRGRLYLRNGPAFQLVARLGLTDRRTVEAIEESHRRTKRAFDYLWSDRDEDGRAQIEECAFQEAKGNIAWSAGYWGGYWLDDNFNIVIDGSSYHHDAALKIPRVGWSKSGVPIWDAERAAVWLNRPKSQSRVGSSAGQLLLAHGDTIILGHDPISAVKQNGEIAWSYPCRWWGVHGSHHAPIPESDAVIVGMLSCIGTADTGGPIGRVFGMNSNMGRLYIINTGGLFIASVFQDCRVGPDPWPAEAKRGVPMGGVSMGAEWFGGYFFKSEDTGEYFLIAGGTSYNLIRLSGFDSLRPLVGGEAAFTKSDFTAAERLQQERVAAKARQRNLTIAKLPAAASVDGKLDEYAKDAFVSWSSGRYKARAAVCTDGPNLNLAFEVSADRNPMVNGGEDFTHLFVTGDSVNLHLGTDPDASVKRREAASGDVRLLISVLDEKPVAVLYRWKVRGAKKPVTFTCPWRSHTVDSVTVLADARISIARRGHGYVVEAAVPLKSLGFSPEVGKSYKLDLGVIYSDAKGNNRAARMYWSNKATGLVADVPGEIMAQPSLWGTATLE